MLCWTGRRNKNQLSERPKYDLLHTCKYNSVIRQVDMWPTQECVRDIYLATVVKCFLLFALVV